MLFITINVLYSLQVYYELDEQRTKEDAKDVAVCRVEKLCPFPYDCPTRAQKISKYVFSICSLEMESVFFFFFFSC